MKRTQPALILFISLFMPVGLYAQAWSGIISPTRAVDWSGVGIPGGVPSGGWTQCGTTIAPYGTSASPASPSTINSAIASCGTNQYVLLGAGDFYLDGVVDFATHSNVVLRGQGANQTRLHFTGTTLSGCNGWWAAVCLEGSNTYGGGGYTQADWTAGYSQGTTQITLSSVSGIVANLTPIVLDQCNTGFSGSSGTETCTGTAVDNDNAFICDTTSVCISQTPTTGLYRTNRAQEEVVIATNISGTGPYTVTISPGLRNPNWASGNTPQAWWGSATITNSGLENLMVDESTVGQRAICLTTAYKCWVKGVATTTANLYHVFNYVTSHDVIRDSYFYWTYNASIESYGVGGGINGDLLTENNIFQGVTDPVTFDASCAGCVAGYNFGVNQYDTASTYLFPSIAFHSAGESMILVEGNIGAQVDQDDIHGTHDFNTFFRNYLNGYESNNGTQTLKNTVAFHAGAFTRYSNVIANILGTASYHKDYQCLAPNATTSPCAYAGPSTWVEVYDIGYSGNTFGQTEGGANPTNCGTAGQCPDDPISGSTMFRWGNFDTATNAVRWCGNSSDPGWSTTCGSTSEVPTGDAYYPNTVPSSTSLPQSFYLSLKPSWVPSSASWPLIGPDVTAGSILQCTSGTYMNSKVLSSTQCAGGTSTAVISTYVQANPAMQCYLNTMGGTPDGTGSMLSFNADACYPLPPPAISAAAH
ncbi:MAG: hypothetical protein WAO35_16460 [Terriglobia bacterium]